MKRGIGITPHPAEKHLPEVQVRRWRLDTSGARDLEGNALKRCRWDVEDIPRSAAMALRDHRIARMIQGLPPIDPYSEERFFRPQKEPSPEPKKEPEVAPVVEDTTPLFRDYVKDRFIPWARTRQAKSTVITKERILDHLLQF